MPSPFTISPNPTAVYLTPALHGTLAKVRFAIEERQGLCCILGDAGLGKSTLLRYLNIEFESQENVVTGWIPKARFPSQFAMMKAVCDEFEIPTKRSLAAQSSALEEYLSQQGEQNKTVILFIDEAQMMTGDMLELVRVMLNYETHFVKLLQIVMAGTLELRDRLFLKKNKAIKSRIFAPCLLNALTLEETGAMIQFRCDRLGFPNPFTSPDVLMKLYSLTNGIPRDVLRTCFHAWNLMKSLEFPASANLIESAFEEAQVQQAEDAEEAIAAE